MKINEIKDLVKCIEKKKNIIAKERDSMRDLMYELDEIYLTIESGVEEIEDGIESLFRGIDSISQML